MAELFGGVVTGEITPTSAHYFVAELAARGELAAILTQNVDMLEVAAGIPADKIVEAHGTMRRFRCLDPMCSSEAVSGEAVWPRVLAGDVPVCAACGSTLRPCVVFFGEGLPASFTEARNTVMEHADLLIVIGTSLMVYPFGALVNEVSLLPPRVLINREPVGPFVHHTSDANYRDVALLGDADDGAHALAASFGWPADWAERAAARAAGS